MFFLNSSQHRQLLVEHKSSAEILVRQYYQRIDQLNIHTNAYVIDNRESALKRAIQLDDENQKGHHLGPLHGVPISIKEAFNIKGLKTTVNFPKLKNNIANENSILVDRLQDAGAIVLGKTNVPLLLSDSQTFGPLYPTCNNPFDTTRTPGGSTGGGAAAVASGMSTFEIGSDIGGSIRNPAHYCGLFGLKPTQNGYVQDGHTPPLPETGMGFLMMGCTGPLARSIEDIKVAYDIAYAPRWDYQHYLPIKTPTPTYPSLKGYKIGWYDKIGPHKCDNETVKVIKAFVKTLEDQGAIVEEIELDDTWSKKVYDVWAALFGFVIGQDFNWIMRQLLKLKFRHDSKGSKLNVFKALSKGLSLNFKYFSRTLKQRQECSAEFSRYFDQHDFIISPTSVGPAFKHNPKHKPINVDGENIHYGDYCFAFVAPFNALGHPVLVMPAQQDKEKLPIGLQCISRHHSEPQLLHFGQLLEDAGFKFRAPNIEQS